MNARGFGCLGNDNYTLQADVEESTYEQETGREVGRYQVL